MQQHSERTTLRGDKLKNIEKGRQRVGGLLMPLSLSGGSQIAIVPSWWQAGDQKEDATPCLYASHKANIILVWTSKNACSMLIPNFKMLFNELWQCNYANMVQDINKKFNQPMVGADDSQDQ